MLNSLDAYRESGIRAAKAMNDQDHARYDYEKRRYTRMYMLETSDNKRLAMQAYDEGYKSVQRVLPVQYFR